MPWLPPVSPTPGTTILVAYATANIVNPILWLRLMTGAADPPGTGYVVTSDSTGATSWKTGIAAIGAVLGYTPVNKAGDTGIGDLTSDGTISALGIIAGANGIIAGANGVASAGPVNPASYAGGSTATGTPSVLGLNVGTSGVASAGPVNPASYAGGSTATGTPSVLGLNVGTSGVASAGPVNPASYAGGSTATGTPQVKGLIVGTDGIACAGPVTANGTTIVPVPLGAIVAFATVADLTAAGASWTRHTALDGRLPVGDGTTFSQTFAAATNYGANWTPSSGLSVGTVPVLTDSQTTLVNTGATTSVATATHTHPAPTLNGASTAWLPPMRAVVWARRI
jgi:hypothetical protein